MVIKPIEEIIALELVLSNHYSKVMPKLTKHYLGCYIDERLVGVVTLGWGTRPLHTIKKLFPSLVSKDYYEIGKMAMLEEMPKNSETQMISAVISWIKNNEPQIKILYTWADGMLGKPGYVYQAGNFLYGGYIWTDLYITDKGERVHPRTSQGLSDKGDKICGFRPSKDVLKDRGWNHYKGKQFRYAYFLCNKLVKKQLLSQSTVDWNINYPKADALEWQIQDLTTGDWNKTDKIFYDQSITTKFNKKAVQNKNKLESLELSRKFFEF